MKLIRVAVHVGKVLEPWHRQVIATIEKTPGLVLCKPGTGRQSGQGADVLVDLNALMLERRELATLVFRDEDGLGPEHLAAEAIRAGRRSVLVQLMLITPDGSSTVLEEGALGLVPWNWRASRQLLLNMIAAWPARVLVGQSSIRPRRVILSQQAAHRPTAWQLKAAELRNLVREIRLGALEEQWTVGIIDAPAQDLTGGLPYDRVRWLGAPAGAFLADPMALADSSGLTLLAEVYWYREQRGKIMAVRVGRGEQHNMEVVLERPWHLSYPFLFRYGERTYCLPEMGEARRVQLFWADPFPSRWIEGPVLLEDFAGIDGTLYYDGNYFWLFCTNRDDVPNIKLFLFYSNRLEGGWRPHPWNPVRSDLRNSRPAGPLFSREGALWRPAQECIRTYGGAVVLNRILELTPTRFREEPVVWLKPDPNGPYPDGLHTFCTAGPVTLIDGKRQRITVRRFVKMAQASWRRKPRMRLGG